LFYRAEISLIVGKRIVERWCVPLMMDNYIALSGVCSVMIWV
jgi:hypothetical protein